MKIGKYDIKGRLGRGGMGMVYKAAMPLTGKIVALKVCRPADILLDLMGEDGVRELFLAEAVAMADIRHPNVASVLDVGEADVPHPDGGTMTMPFFAMEYYCTDLGQVMGERYEVERATRVIAPDDALEYARQILEGLRRLHFAGLVHRDVKPFNVMLTDEDQVKLIDFGLSRKRGETQRRPRGMVVGSPYYTAPEQERDADRADERADLFSVGVTLFRMLTGELPVDASGRARTVMELYEAAMRSSSARSRTGHQGWCPDVAWDDFLARAMHPDPAARFSSSSAMLEGLTGLAEHWERAKAEACRWIEPEETGANAQEPGQGGPPVSGALEARLRGEPVKISVADAPARFGLDELWRPVGSRQAELEDQGEIIVDRAHGLIWQRSGSAYPLDHEQAKEYVENLRETRYQGRSGWRLPTVDELSSLLFGPGRAGPDETESMCVPPLFDPVQHRLWSADRKAFTAAWYVDARKGYVWWQDLTCRFYVRAVCGD